MTDEVPAPSGSGRDPTLAAQIEARIAQLDLVAEFEADGLPYSELDENGQVVTRNLPILPPSMIAARVERGAPRSPGA